MVQFRFLVVALLAYFSFAQDGNRPWKRHLIDDSLVGADGVRLADVNGDGFLDIATGWEQSGKSRVYINPGPEKARETWLAVTAGSAPSVEDAVLVDLDRDGRMDVVSSCEGNIRTIFVHWAPEFQWYLDFTAWNTTPLPSSRNRMQWMFTLPVDIDEDGDIDLVAGGKGEHAGIGWFECPQDPRALSAWKWHPFVSVGWTMSLVSLDMDGDGDQDILFSDRRGRDQGCYWLENPGRREARTASWNRHPVGALGREVMFLTVADLDRDGLRDVVVSAKPKELIYLRRLSEDGKKWESFSIHQPENSATAKAVAVAEVDQDGSLDLVFSCEQAEAGRSGVMWMSYRDTPASGSWETHDISGPEGVKYDLVELIDLDGDGDLDVLTCEETERLGVFWYENPL